jgi:hypothetical protein
MEAHLRLIPPRRPIVQRDWGPTSRFIFSLFPGDCLFLHDDTGRRRLYRVASISSGDIELREHDDARTSEQIRETGRMRARGGDTLRKRDAEKVCVTYLGEIEPARD